jgi:hypothetical protein
LARVLAVYGVGIQATARTVVYVRSGVGVGGVGKRARVLTVELVGVVGARGVVGVEGVVALAVRTGREIAGVQAV